MQQNIKLQQQLRTTNAICNNIMGLLEERLGGPYQPSTISTTAPTPLITNFRTLKNGLDGGDFQNLAFEFLTNDT